MLVLYNGKFISPKRPIISVTSDAFNFGHGAFETLRTYNKIIFKPEEHINRLFNSVNKIGVSTLATKKRILEDLKKIVNKSKEQNQRLKVILIREGIVITSQSIAPLKKLENGISLLTVVQRRVFPDIKTIAFIDSYVSHMKAVNKGYFDALLVDEMGEVYEGSHSNIFWFESDTLCTRGDYVLQGITRETVLEISPFKSKLKTITYPELSKVREIFMTQTSVGVLPVTQIDKHKIGDGKIGKNTLQIMKLFKEYTESYK